MGNDIADEIHPECSKSVIYITIRENEGIEQEDLIRRVTETTELLRKHLEEEVEH